ncbi:MAG: HAD family hydrolase, partial [Gammaproteobacteria bacterium]|nr:HAD family hydrolase [Gammaproteobacteria bacterium]
GFPLGRFMVVGDSGNDEDMLTGETLAVIVANYSHELEKLKGKNRIYFANSHHAWGVLEGLEYYDFLGDIRVPGEEIDEDRKIA